MFSVKLTASATRLNNLWILTCALDSPDPLRGHAPSQVAVDKKHRSRDPPVLCFVSFEVPYLPEFGVLTASTMNIDRFRKSFMAKICSIIIYHVMYHHWIEFLFHSDSVNFLSFINELSNESWQMRRKADCLRNECTSDACTRMKHEKLLITKLLCQTFFWNSTLNKWQCELQRPTDNTFFIVSGCYCYWAFKSFAHMTSSHFALAVSVTLLSRRSCVIFLFV